MNIAEELDKALSEVFEKTSREYTEDPRQRENTKMFLQELSAEENKAPEVGEIYEVDKDHHFVVVSNHNGLLSVMGFSPIDVPGTNGDLQVMEYHDHGPGLRVVLTWTNVFIKPDMVQQYKLCGKLNPEEIDDLVIVFDGFINRKPLDPKRFGWRVGSSSASSEEEAKIVGHWMFERTLEWRTLLA